MAILTNEYFLGGVVIVLCLGILIHKFFGLKRFFGFFRSSGDRVEASREAAAERSKPEPAADTKGA